ncbi:MAG: 4Fe-4S binding protein [Sulfurimicrobium sp.]
MPATTANKSSVSFKRLAANQPMWFCADACLKLRPSGTECEACRDACPVQAIRVEASLVELAPACTGCGQCAAVCPSGALLAEGFDVLSQPLPESEGVPLLRIECSRVPHKLAGNARQVPCLGGIPFFALIGLVARNSCAVALVDRGWCATCPSGGENEPIKTLVDAVRAVVADIGLPDERSPYVDSLPTSQAQALSPVATADNTPLPRRAFFGALLKRTAEAAVAVRSPDTARLAVKTTRGALMASPLIRHTRKRMAASLVEIAGLAGKPLPARFFPDISVSESCRLHGVCSAVCPSGALETTRSGTSAGPPAPTIPPRGRATS